jgi:hypothetical protein
MTKTLHERANALADSLHKNQRDDATTIRALVASALAASKLIDEAIADIDFPNAEAAKATLHSAKKRLTGDYSSDV